MISEDGNFLNPSYCRKKFGMSTCSCTTGSKEKLNNVSWPLGQESTKPKAQQEPQRVKRENWCVTVKISSMKDIKVMSNEQQVNHMENC